MTTPTDTATHLSEQQLARVDALKVAREVLASKVFVSSGAVDPAPLIDVAHYVITGRDRWQNDEETTTDGSSTERAAQ